MSRARDICLTASAAVLGVLLGAGSPSASTLAAAVTRVRAMGVEALTMRRRDVGFVPDQQPTKATARWRFALATLTTVLVSLLAAPQTASAATLTMAETRVGAITAMAPSIVGFDQGVWASQRQVHGPPQAELVVATGVAANSAGGLGEAFHYTDSKWLNSMMENGLREGTYATPNGALSPLQRTLDLALPPNRPLTNATVRIDVAGLRAAGYEIPQVTRVSGTVTGAGGRVYTMPGGGYEMKFPYGLPPEFLRVVS